MTHRRFSIFGALIVAGAVAVGCGGPYKGPPEKLPRVKQTKEPEAVADAAPDIKWDDECTARFNDDPANGKRGTTAAGASVAAGDDAFANAARAPDPQGQIGLLVAAIEQYKRALVDDHYNGPATFKLAVAYAKVRKRGCALRMLKRLAELGVNAKLAGGPSRLDSLLRSVEDEPAFQPFRKEAMEAIGR